MSTIAYAVETANKEWGEVCATKRNGNRLNSISSKLRRDFEALGFPKAECKKNADRWRWNAWYSSFSK